MSKKTLVNLSLLLAACTTFPAAMAYGHGQDGVNVGEKSVFSKFGGGKLEQQAALQYQQTMLNAKQQNALGPDNHPQVIRLRAIAKKLIPYALKWNEHAKDWKWEVNLIGSKQVNAYCMPGGKIAFYTGILDTLKLTDDEVAMIMGHEIAHALREHGQERAGKTAAANIAVKLAEIYAGYKGVDPNVAGAVGGGFAKVALLSFSRADETEADVVGLDLAARAGYDPRAGVTLWQKMGMLNKNAPPPWLSTHPSGPARIEEIKKHFPEVMPLYARAKGVEVSALPPYQPNVKGLAPVTYPN